MPANPPPEVRRGKLLHGLFWGGMALAPIAVLILLFGQSAGALRVAVTLAVLTIVMLAISIAMRPSVEMLRVDIEHRVLDEIERVRVRAREETTTAARNTHRALTDKIHELAGSVQGLQAQLDEVQASGVLAPQSAPALGGAPGVVRRTETVHVTRRTTTVDAGEDDGRGTVYGSRAASVDGEWRDGGREADWRDDPREERPRDQRWDGMAQGDRWAAMRADEHGRELHIGERRSSVHSDERGAEYRVEDRWAALRRDEPAERRGDGEPGWEAASRTMGRPTSPRALPPSHGEPPSRYTDAWDDDREPARSRGRDRGDRETDRRDDWERAFERGYDRGREPDRDRGRPDRDRGYDDRGRDDRGYEDRRRDDRGRDDRGWDDRGYDDRRRDDRGWDDRGRDDRGRDDRGRGYDRDRDYDHERERHERERDRDREPPYAPRPRSAQPSEYDR
jgi:hypothetical protein